MHVFNMLFLCTTNSTLSIMAEALAARASNGRFAGFSAGSAPSDSVHSYALDAIRSLGYPLENLRPKHWNEYTTPQAPVMHLVIGLCSTLADMGSPAWPGAPSETHWRLSDPIMVTGSDDNRRYAFKDAFYGLQRRLQLLCALPLETMDSSTVISQVAALPNVHRQLPRLIA